jgi:ribosomal protein S18 acetylase RimI-like enzyme
MSNPADVALRWARPDDRDALLDVCRRTGDAGQDATGLLHHGDLYGLIYAAPYLRYEPECSLVAEHLGIVAGYALGAPDTAAFEARLEADWWPPLRERHPLPGDGTDLDRHLVGQLHHPLRTPPEVTDRYPAHLHIDLLPVLQGQGVGRRMIDMLLTQLAARGATGVHLGVDPRNARAVGFYEHLGFARHGNESVVLFTKRL